MLEEIKVVLKSIHIRQDHHAEWMEHIERKLDKLMANVQDLNTAIAALPQRIADEIVPLIPILPPPPDPGSGVDTSVQIEALNRVPSQVSSLVAAAIAAGTPPVTDTTPVTSEE